MEFVFGYIAAWLTMALLAAVQDTEPKKTVNVDKLVTALDSIDERLNKLEAK